MNKFTITQQTFYRVKRRERKEEEREQEKMDSVGVRVMNRQNQDSHQAEISEEGRPFLLSW